MDTVEKLLNVFYRVRLLYLVTFCCLVTVGGVVPLHELSPVVTRLMERCETRETERSPGCQEFDEWPSPTATAPIQPYTHPGAALYFLLNISLSLADTRCLLQPFSFGVFSHMDGDGWWHYTAPGEVWERWPRLLAPLIAADRTSDTRKICG